MDSPEDAKWLQIFHSRVKWTKRFLRYVPRRTTVHKYPGLKWAKDIAKNRMYLWSFRYREVAPALYVGTIISLLPVFGVQIPLALAFALILRANLPVFVALQFITNWFTIVPIYYICYEIGRWSLKFFDIHVETLTLNELRLFMDNLAAFHWSENSRFLVRVFAVTSLGGVILGSFLGTVFDMIYRFLAWRTKIVWERVTLIRERRREERIARLAAEMAARNEVPNHNESPNTNSLDNVNATEAEKSPDIEGTK